MLAGASFLLHSQHHHIGSGLNPMLLEQKPGVHVWSGSVPSKCVLSAPSIDMFSPERSIAGTRGAGAGAWHGPTCRLGWSQHQSELQNTPDLPSPTNASNGFFCPFQMLCQVWVNSFPHNSMPSLEVAASALLGSCIIEQEGSEQVLGMGWGMW